MPPCKRCGEKLVIGARFCRTCGAPAKLPKHSRPQPPPPAPRVQTSLTHATIQADAPNPSLSRAGPAPASSALFGQSLPRDLQPDSTAEFAAAPDAGLQIFDGAAATEVDDRGRLVVGLIAAAGVALLVILVVVVIALGGDDGAGGDDGQDQAARVDLSAAATISVPATAPDNTDWAGKRVRYGPENLVDDDPATAWRMEGDGTGEELTISWKQPQTVSEVGLINGYAKTDSKRENFDWYEINRRVLNVTWVFDDGTEVVQPLKEVTDLQKLALDAPVETQTLRLRFDEVSAPSGRDFTALSEIHLR